MSDDGRELEGMLRLRDDRIATLEAQIKKERAAVDALIDVVDSPYPFRASTNAAINAVRKSRDP